MIQAVVVVVVRVVAVVVVAVGLVVRFVDVVRVAVEIVVGVRGDRRVVVVTSGLGQTTGLLGSTGAFPGRYSLLRTSDAVASSTMTTISVVTERSMVVAVLLFLGITTPLCRVPGTLG